MRGADVQANVAVGVELLLWLLLAVPLERFTALLVVYGCCSRSVLLLLLLLLIDVTTTTGPPQQQPRLHILASLSVTDF